MAPAACAWKRCCSCAARQVSLCITMHSSVPGVLSSGAMILVDVWSLQKLQESGVRARCCGCVRWVSGKAWLQPQLPP